MVSRPHIRFIRLLLTALILSTVVPCGLVEMGTEIICLADVGDDTHDAPTSELPLDCCAACLLCCANYTAPPLPYVLAPAAAVAAPPALVAQAPPGASLSVWHPPRA